jgi:hypothetical protein
MIPSLSNQVSFDIGQQVDGHGHDRTPGSFNLEYRGITVTWKPLERSYRDQEDLPGSMAVPSPTRWTAASPHWRRAAWSAPLETVIGDIPRLEFAGSIPIFRSMFSKLGSRSASYHDTLTE